MYRIDVVKTIGGEPMITVEKRAAALYKVRELAEAYEAELNAEMMPEPVRRRHRHNRICQNQTTDSLAESRGLLW